jgi:hypothetical protein
MTGKRAANFGMALVSLFSCLWVTPQVRAEEAKPVGSEAPRMEFVYEETVTLGASIHPWATPFGERNIVPITGGTFT